MSVPVPSLVSLAMVPAWLTLPVAALVMLIVAAHVLAIQNPAVPASRRRIRTASGILILIAVPLFAYAVTVSHGRDPRTFVLVWVAVMALIGMIVLLALLDIVNNLRLSARARADLGAQSAQELARGVAARRAGAAPPGGGAGHSASAEERDG